MSGHCDFLIYLFIHSSLSPRQGGEYATDEEEDEDEMSPSYRGAIEVFDLVENEDMSPLETDPEKLAHKYKEVSPQRKRKEDDVVIIITPCITRGRRRYVLHNTLCTGALWQTQPLWGTLPLACMYVNVFVGPIPPLLRFGSAVDPCLGTGQTLCLTML